MGTMGNGENGSPHDGGGPQDGVPDLPPEWGTIIIPDDLSVLADESAEVRRELKRQARREIWRRRFGGREATLRVPLLIMSIAILATLVSLAAMAWPGTPRRPAIQRTAAAAPSTGMPALDLIDVDGAPVSLRGLLPAVILLTDGCACADLVADTSATAPNDVTVITVTRRAAPTPRAHTPPAPESSDAPVRTLTDPADELRGHLRLGPPTTTAAVVLVRGDGEILTTVGTATSVEDFRTDLVRLS
ncbi:hypothetical protein WEI85_07390 [Actinomycetes bacterium KLBMP 9797]